MENSSAVPVLVSTASLAQGERYVLIASGQVSSDTFGVAAEPPAPLIAVQQPAGTALTSGVSTVNFGNSPLNTAAPLTFTIQNNGSTAMTISGVTIDGTNSADFAVTTAPASTVTQGTSTTMVVTFTPSTILYRTAVLHLSSNDPNTGTFNLTLAGNCPGALTATFNSPTNIPAVLPNFIATGSTVNFTLNFAPVPGTILTVVNNTGPNFPQGVFSNLAQGQLVSLPFNGSIYTFAANYFGGTGNDLVLGWFAKPAALGAEHPIPTASWATTARPPATCPWCRHQSSNLCRKTSDAV